MAVTARVSNVRSVRRRLDSPSITITPDRNLGVALSRRDVAPPAGAFQSMVVFFSRSVFTRVCHASDCPKKKKEKKITMVMLMMLFAMLADYAKRNT